MFRSSFYFTFTAENINKETQYTYLKITTFLPH